MTSDHLWEAGWYEANHKPGILALNQIEYGDSPLAQEAYFDWMYTKNPMGKPIVPVAYKTGSSEVVSFLMMVPARISWQGEGYPVLIGVNVLTSKEYRRQGVSAVIYQMATEEGRQLGYHLSLAFPNPKSLGLAQKNQDNLVGKIPLVIRPLDISRLARDRLSNPISRWILSMGWNVAQETIFRERTLAELNFPVTVVEDDEPDEAYDRFWEKVKTKSRLMLVRDRAFLQWRFVEIPHRSYQILSVRQENEILGYIVLRMADVRGIRCGLIGDFLVTPGKLGDQVGLHLLHLAAQRFRQEKLALSGGFFIPGTQEYSLLRRAGYLPCPTRYAPQQFHLIVHNLSFYLPTDTITRRDSWFITLADHDAV